MDVDFEVLGLISAKQGDEQAWAILFDRHFQAVYRYCLSLARGRQDVAEEIAQQVFVTAARHIVRFKPGRGTFRTWLHGIARKRLAKHESKEVRRRQYETRLNAESSKNKNGRQQQLFVYETLALLPIHYRLVLEAKYLEGLTVGQIAEAQGCTAKAMESRLGRAREKFGQIYRKLRDLNMS
jgi:RNA polymerase sigma-70 factor (ECF subfamily)